MTLDERDRYALVMGANEWDLPRDEATVRLVDRYGGLLHALARKLCRGPEEAEDLVQEVFLNAYRGWDGFEGRSDPASWLWTIAARACQRMHRPRSGEPKLLETLDESLFTRDELGALPESGLDAAERSELVERLRAAVADLPQDHRMALVLRDVVGLSVAQTATALGVAQGTVKSRLHRARIALRAELESGLPQVALEPARYDRAVCIDLLEAKQDALDRGVPFPVGDEVVCERCRAVFATFDLTCDLVRDMGREELPREVRQRLLERVQTAG
ncbi:ECF RNA polymerase sigma factor SigW [Planctomycetes bacterium Pla163]|uniref:RNA polymerase sigma factor n=1 Tax=Rohdeia mirabilis TaxID=2528008 RepID=A0A518D1D3_9BACT|nr:ECF RNA polymerase sigma factor SigW [Planctomycetes bacterium Pla163]